VERLKQLYEAWKGVLNVWRDLGPWGPFTIGAIDAAAFGIPLDFVVGDYAHANRGSFTYIALGVFLASLGSALGSLVPYWVGRKGGEPLLLKKISHARLEELRDRYEKWEFFFLMVPAMLPPPTPMKLLTLTAGTFEMRVPLFLAALTLGRVLRFALLSYVVVLFGPQKIKEFGRFIAENWPLFSFGMFAVVAALILVFRYRTRKRAA
jgi:membrane protein YqaA with SNARE-associated domain